MARSDNKSGKCFSSLTEERFKENPDYQEAYQFSAEFEPQKDVRYTWVYEHGMELCRQGREAIDVLDKKAEHMVKFLGPTSGFLVIAVNWLFHYKLHVTYVTMIPAILAILCFGFGLYAALRALRPVAQPLLPSTRVALESIAFFGSTEEARGNVVAGFDIAIQAQAIITKGKSACLRLSFKMFVFGFLSLLCALMLALPIFPFSAVVG